ncbi:MAG TPA: hypothetical protein PLA43_18985 [Bryobacteraceae bacterium]|nr:hypothetical protein [Bryobacteraceae bacterium]HOL71327.1 hypothetical protein [Bryobacteraceae bacterium]HOQ47446.1 hypothetical protein [Bryobacteraceae bacterium]HPQ17127.1 hypothetical protein [Bryobacteraceae bacterium]HPU74045.1 hypothetical protein [Bryobacteraceae bacterium]
MSESPIPPQLEPMSRRPFSFYPPILNIEHNEWRFKKATWSEVLVANAKSDLEIWIPRRLLGEISSVDEPIMIVGLTRELEYRAGSVWPHERRVIQMPPPPMREAPRPEQAPAPPESRPLSAIRGRTDKTESRVSRLIAMLLGGVAVVLAFLLFIIHGGAFRTVKFTATDQDFLMLSRTDDYFSVVRKLGPPGEDRWREKSGELQYRALWYPERSYYIILLGTDRNDARYIGALDRNWRVIHYVDLPNGGTTASLMRGLQKF